MIHHGGPFEHPESPHGLPSHLARLLPADAQVVSQAPGRANLIGEHTDYNEGLVLPAALELRVVIGGRRAKRIRLRSAARGTTVEVDPESGDGPARGWGRYVGAVVRSLRDAHVAVRGIDGVVASDVPLGTGLSSSAALEVAVALAIADEPIGAVELARICRHAENRYVGVQSGIMDPLVSAAGVAGAALLIDCRSLAIRPVALPGDLCLMVIDSGERRELRSAGYNDRRRECEEAARLLGVRSLRDVSPDDVARAGLPEPIASRARHVVTENERVTATAAALEADDRGRIGELFAASHASLATDFAVSTPALDALVEIAAGTAGVVAARMTGGGFGGCTVNLVQADAAESALRDIANAYERRTGARARGWISRPSAGALSASGGA
jgi:galactokinase